MTSATIGQWDLAVDVSGGSTFVNVEEVLTVSGVGVTQSSIDVTNFDSPAGTKEFISALSEGDEITIECNYVPAATTQNALVTSTGDTVNWQLSYATSTKTYTFLGVNTGWTVNPSTSDANKISFRSKITGDITIGGT